jgi:hypothetical protein
LLFTADIIECTHSKRDSNKDYTPRQQSVSVAIRRSCLTSLAGLVSSAGAKQ